MTTLSPTAAADFPLAILNELAPFYADKVKAVASILQTCERRPPATDSSEPVANGCPHCGNPLLLILEEEEEKWVTELHWVGSRLTWEFGLPEEQCRWLDTPTSGASVCGCPACGSVFGNDATVPVATRSDAEALLFRVLDADPVASLDREAGNVALGIDPRGEPVAFGAGDAKEPAPCPLCGANDWVIWAFAETLWLSVLDEDGHESEHQPIGDRFAEWQIHGCGSCQATAGDLAAMAAVASTSTEPEATEAADLEKELACAGVSLRRALETHDRTQIGEALGAYLQLFEAAVAAEGLTLDASSWSQRGG